MKAFESLDQAVQVIREDYDSQIKAMQDKLLAAEIEAALARDLLAKATAEKDLHMQITARLLSQFDMAEKVFADIKSYAKTLPSVNGVPSNGQA